MVFAYTHFLPRAVFTSWFSIMLYCQLTKNQTFFLVKTAIDLRSFRSRVISKECFSLVIFSGENTKFVRLLFTFMFVQKLLLHATLKNTFAYRKNATRGLEDFCVSTKEYCPCPSSKFKSKLHLSIVFSLSKDLCSVPEVYLKA